MSSQGRGRGRGGDGKRPPGGGGGYRGSQGSNFNRGFRGGFGSGSTGRLAPAPAPSPEVTRLEDAAFPSDLSQAVESLMLNDQTSIAARPGYGTRGDQVVLYANYFQLKLEKEVPMYRYSISVKAPKGQPETRGKKLARIIELLLQQINVESLVTDFSSILISGVDLFSKDKAKSREYAIRYSAEGFDADSTSPTFRVMVKHVTTVGVQQLLDHLSTTISNEPYPQMKPNVLQALNIVLAHGLEQSGAIVSVKNKYFPVSGALAERFGLDVGVEAFRGYFLSMRPATGRILLNAQVQHLAMYEPQTLDALMAKLGYDGSNTTDLRKIEKFIRGIPIRLIHFSPPRAKKISGFAAKTDGQGLENPPQVQGYAAKADQVKFYSSSEDRYVTVAEYFRTQYNTRSKFPVINTGTSKDPVYTLAEKCSISPGEPYRRKLSPFQTSKMIDIAVRRPNENKMSITENGRALIENFSKPKLQDYGIAINTSLITITARVLDAPKLVYQQRTTVPTSTQPKTVLTQASSWKPYEQKVWFNRTQPLSSSEWHYVWIKPKGPGPIRSLKEVEAIADAMHQSLVSNGVMAQKAVQGHLLDLGETNWDGRINALFSKISQRQPPPRLLFIVLADNNKAVYNAIKTAGDITFGFHTICVLPDKLKKGSGAVLGNIALKFNLKLGGHNQEVTKEELSFISLGETMVVGADVTHPAPGDKKQAPSIASVVASVDESLGQWPADIRIQTRREEMVQAYKEMIVGRLRVWQKHNKSGRGLPREILVYRDGVSESQYELVLQKELPQIRAACQEVYPPEATKQGFPLLTIIVVGKRHHTRFYPTDSSKGFKDNPQNGTVVDRGVTESRIWDFYLQAHTPLQGTAKPAHYVVLHDEIFTFRAKQGPATDGRTPGQQKADMAQTITHNMCYLFGRANRAVSVCPPAYYADIACERARCWLSRLYGDHDSDGGSVVGDARPDEVRVHPRLTDSMFYI